MGQLFDNLKAELSDIRITNDPDGTIHIRGSKINLDLPASKNSIHIDSKDLKIDAEGQLGPGAKGLTAPAQLKQALPKERLKAIVRDQLNSMSKEQLNGVSKGQLKAIEESVPAMIP